MFNSGLQQQVFQRPKAELCFRPWWDFVEDCALSTMLAIGKMPRALCSRVTKLTCHHIHRVHESRVNQADVSRVTIEWPFIGISI